MKTIPYVPLTFILLATIVSNAHGTLSYQYDVHGRLAMAKFNEASAPSYNLIYEYDLVGNITNIGFDGDGDGMPDYWEAANGLNPVFNDAALDADGDGFLNGEEYAKRTDPNNMPRIFVRDHASPAGDGTSWSSPFPTLQDALRSTRLKAEIWVSAGLYQPDWALEGEVTPGGRAAAFVLKNGVAIYGGFGGYENSLAQRNLTGPQTVLSGELGGSSSADNSYHVVISAGNDSTAILDGVVIRGGMAKGVPGYPGSQGGGIVIDGGSPVIRNTTIISNEAEYGGGMAVLNASPSLVNVTCQDNIASSGGGLLNYGGSPIITQLTLRHNTASSVGGGMANINGSPSIANATISDNISSWGSGYFGSADHATIRETRFERNQASNMGGGLYIEAGSTAIDRSLIVSNTAGFGAGLCSIHGTLNTTNTIFVGNAANFTGGAVLADQADRSVFDSNNFFYNSAGSSGGVLFVDNGSRLIVSNSIIGDNYAPGNTLVALNHYSSSVDINFSYVASGDAGIVILDPGFQQIITYQNNLSPPAYPGLSSDLLHLQPGSPCIDAGGPIAGPMADFDGEQRPKGARRDIGVDEY